MALLCGEIRPQSRHGPRRGDQPSADETGNQRITGATRPHVGRQPSAPKLTAAAERRTHKCLRRPGRLVRPPRVQWRRSVSFRMTAKLRPPKLNPCETVPRTPTLAPLLGTPYLWLNTQIWPVPSST